MFTFNIKQFKTNIMNKIEIYKELKLQLEAVNNVQAFSLKQIDHELFGGLSNVFIIEGASPLFLKAMLSWATNNGLNILNDIKEYMAQETNEALLEAEAEMKEFINITLPKEQEYLANKEYIVVPETTSTTTTTDVPILETTETTEIPIVEPII